MLLYGIHPLGTIWLINAMLVVGGTSIQKDYQLIRLDLRLEYLSRVEMFFHHDGLTYYICLAVASESENYINYFCPTYKQD